MWQISKQLKIIEMSFFRVAEAVERGESVAIVVDGQSLSVTMNDKMNHQLFLSIGLKCDAVLCCRLSPLQKSQVADHTYQLY